MRTSLKILVLLCVAPVIAALAGSAHAAPLKIVTTTSDLASITRALAGDRAAVRCVADGREDPHYLQARPGYIVMARDAALWISVGMDLEIGWEPAILDSARNARIRPGAAGYLDSSQSVLKLDIPTGPITRAMGDVHPAGNPHHWLDPYNGRIIAHTIARRLCEIDPAGTQVYEVNLAAFTGRLDAAMFGAELVGRYGGDLLWTMTVAGGLERFLESEKASGSLGGWAAAMAPHAGKAVVIYHKSWNYFLNRFRLVVAAELEPKPGIPPSARHLQAVVADASTAGALAVLQEPYYEQKSGRFVASKAGLAHVVAANSVGGQSEAVDYVSMIDNAVIRVSKALAP